MKTAYISLTFVRLAVKKPGYPNMWTAALSTRYRPALNYDGTFLHGAVVIFDGVTR